MLRPLFITFAAALAVVAQPDGPIPAPNTSPTNTSEIRLIGKRFPFDALPFKADTSAPTVTPIYRGEQSGYNNCTGRPASQDAMCQTLIVNSIEDFCVFAPPTLNTIGDLEGEVVAYCTGTTHGSRVIPAGTITGAQFLRAPSYVEVTGFINQENINIAGGEGTGGELDSGGQDQRGNPIGGLAYSNSLPSTKGAMTQSVAWHMFIGNGMFCLKLCDNESPNARGLCRHTLDTYGCNINVPAQMVDGVFLACDSDDQLPVAVGVTDIPKSSNCVTYASTSIYPVSSGIPSATAHPSPSATPTPSASGSVTRSGGATTTSGTSKPSNTSPPPGSASSQSVSMLGAMFGFLLALVVVV